MSRSTSTWARAGAGRRRHLGRVADGALIGGDAAGWGGDRYELWQRGTCAAAPCRSEDVLVMRWSVGHAEAARAFEAALRAAPIASATAPRSTSRGDTVTLVLAPSAALAAGLIASDA